MRMRAKPKPEPVDLLAEAMALCVESYRPQAVGRVIERGARLPLSDPRVRACPQHWIAAVPMVAVLERER